jgi:hypothetical protein
MLDRTLTYLEEVYYKKNLWSIQTVGIEPNLHIFQDIMLEIYAKGESTLKVNHFAPKKNDV